MDARRIAPLLVLALASFSCLAQEALDGAGIYGTYCAACHSQPPDDKTPARAALERMTPSAIVAAMREGAMRVQGSALSEFQQVAVAEYLSGAKLSTAGDITQGRCERAPGKVDVSTVGAWQGWGGDMRNARSVADSEISAANISSLTLAYAYGLPDATQMRSQPAVFGNRMFFGSQSGRVFAVDAYTGCTYWNFKAANGVRTAISLGTIDHGPHAGATALYFSDTKATAYAVDSETGALLWSRKVDEHPAALGTGAPTLHDGVLYVPVSGLSEEAAATTPQYECCTFRGSVSALDAATGEVIWKYFTVPESRLLGHTADGRPQYGPAGGGVWSAPTIDARRGLLYLTTGNAYATPAVPTSNAVVALDFKTGQQVWGNQLLPGDIWVYGCDPVTGGGDPDAASRPNCPENLGPDFDFSASALLTTRADGKEVIVVTQKSGVGYALDPDAGGRELWRYRWGVGSAAGGVWGAAADDRNAYFAVADNFSGKGGGLHAVDLLTGERRWFTPPQPMLCGDQPACAPIQSSAVTVVGDVVFSGSGDGGMRAYSTATGEVLWRFDTNQPFETVNGVQASGGSIDGPGQVVANGMLYVMSGNGGPFGRPGNVLLAFKPGAR